MDLKLIKKHEPLKVDIRAVKDKLSRDKTVSEIKSKEDKQRSLKNLS